ncbi:HAD-IIA family hydrolase [Alginatibacterium sediminis]|uniref:Ribonucleotide monophosphatase NagD n=1 Tax=Alginatibacterium sediminis TaxID=2164068 RepID=A0A420EID3_9ALTE|nr:HAD-IIA family hydrolase [Alginatibacterium sediminis]RKF20413.1 HAD-IIA family hydrolase [Alginatibacterium sediminis]
MKSVICDIDGVLLHNNQLIDGADKFLLSMLNEQRKLVILTNYPAQTPQDLKNRFLTAGVDIPESCFYTSAMATADFLTRQEGNKAFVIGEGALIHELYSAGFTITDINPDFVIIGETKTYNWTMIHQAAQFVAAGAQFIATNPDTHGPNMSPACGALCAPIERITGRKPFYVGKPSAWIIRAALNKMGAHAENTVIIGDNLRTDILAGFQAGLETIFVLSGVSSEKDIDDVPFRPNYVFGSVKDIDVL